MTEEQIEKLIRVQQDRARINTMVAMIQVWAMSEVTFLCAHRVSDPNKPNLPAR